MVNKSFMQIEKLTYSFPPETCWPDCIWLMAAADLDVDLFSLTRSTISFQGYVFIGSVRKMIHSANLNARLP